MGAEEGGASALNLTAHPALEGHPQWDPTGQHVLFYRYEDGDADLYRIPASGGEAINLTRSPGDELVGSWSPDGEQIAVVNYKRIKLLDARTLEVTAETPQQIRDISPNPETHYGWGSADINYRFWWTYPVVVSPHDPGILYVTSQFVHKTTNEGESWEIVSPVPNRPLSSVRIVKPEFSSLSFSIRSRSSPRVTIVL